MFAYFDTYISALYSFMSVWVTDLCPFISSWRILFSIFYRADLVRDKFSQYLFTWECLNFPFNIWRVVLLDIEFLVDSLFVCFVFFLFFFKALWICHPRCFGPPGFPVRNQLLISLRPLHKISLLLPCCFQESLCLLIV